MYNLSVQTFQIRSLITQDLWIVQIIAFLEFDKRVVKYLPGTYRSLALEYLSVIEILNFEILHTSET